MKDLTIRLALCFAVMCAAVFCTSAQSFMMSDCDADFEIGSQEFTADGWLVHFINTSEAEGGIGDVIWDFGDGGSSEEFEPSHLYATEGEFEVCIIITNEAGSCTDDRCDHFDVGELDGDCEADWDWEDDGLTVNFTDDSESDAGAIVTYAWDFGDGTESSEPDPEHVYDVSGEYNVCLSIITDEGCFSTFCDDVDVEGSNGECTAFFAVESITPQDGGFVVVFNNETSGGIPGGETPYLWDFDDPSPLIEGADQEHFFTEPGTYVVCLYAGIEGGACYDNYCSEIVLSETTTAITDNNSIGLFIYPNPVTDNLFIETTQAYAADISISDMMGAVMYHSSINTIKSSISLHEFSPGTYLLNYKSEAGTMNTKIIVQ